jgi:hypothetical protein
LKLLFDNAFAPLTFRWGFIDAPVDAVTRAYRRWQRRILHAVTITPVNLPLEEALGLLPPLDMGSQRVLFLGTRSAWTACFDNGARGGNPATFVGELSHQLHCRGVACTSVPNTLTRATARTPGTWGAVQFTLFGPGAAGPLNVVRSVAAGNDAGGWEFTVRGVPQPFEQVDRYASARIADRFTPEMLADYCRALGIDCLSPDFYGGPGVVTYSRPWFLRRPGTVTLAEARRQLGLPVSLA